MNLTSNRRGWRLLAIPIALGLLACAAAPASATDGIEIRPATNSGVYDPVIFTTAGETVTRQVPFRVRHNGINNHLLPGVQVRAIPGGTAPANVTMSPSAYMTIPIGWAPGSTVPADGSVSIVAPTTLGRHDYPLTWVHEPVPPSYCDIVPCLQSFAPRTYTVYVQPRAASSLAIDVDGTDAEATWNLSPDDAQLTGYTVTRQIAGNPGSQVSWNVAPGTSSRSDAGLAPGTEYCWTVRAYKIYNPSAAALVSPVIQTCATTGSAPSAPGAPAGPAIDTDGDYTVAWAAATDADSDDVTYTLERRDADDANWSEVATGLTATSYDVSEDEGVQSYRVRATDETGLAGAYAESTTSTVVDGTAPSAPTASTDPASPVFDGWFKDTVTVSFGDSTDPALADGSPGTGIADYTDAITVTDHGTTTVSGTATDGAGNESDATDATVKVDASGPTVELTCPTDPILENTSATASWTAEDTGSGLATPASGMVGLDTSTAGTHTATAAAGTATDNVGHDSAAATCEYEVFANSAPTAPGAPSGPSIDTDGDFDIAWTASTDPDDDEFTYTLETRDADDAGWTQVADGLTATTYSVENADEGSHSYRVSATDEIGAASAWSESVAPVVVDGTPPTAPTATTTPANPVADGWFKDTVAVAFGDSADPALADGSAGTGVADYTDAVTVTDHGSTTVNGTATDGAGNESAAAELTVKVDTSSPTVELTCPTAPVLKDSEAVATYAAADTGSGLDTPAAGTVDLDTATPGTQTASVTAADKVGHESTDTCEYEVFENHAPAAPGAPVGPATDRDGEFELSWSPATDPDNDDVTYALDRKDADDADWALVADGITGTTYEVTENEGTHSYRVRAVDELDAASDSTESANPVVVDGTPPSAPDATTDPAAPVADGWFKDVVTVSFDGSADPGLADGSAGTGVAEYSDPVTFDTEGSHTASGTATDGAGNESDATEEIVKVDTSVPVVEISCPTTPLLVGSDGTAEWTATDSGSGLATPASGSVELDTSTPGPKTAEAPVASDAVGHDSAVASCSYAVYDNVAPGAPGAPGGPASDRDGEFTVTWDPAIDPDGDDVTYVLEQRDANDSGWSPAGSGLTQPERAVDLADGSWSFRVRAVDEGGASSGWIESVMPVKVDGGAPSAPVASTDPAAPVVNGWFKDTVSVSFAGSTDPSLADGSTGSGIASYTATQSFNTEGTHTASGTATDNAGNESAATTKTVKVDATAPVTQIACPSEPLIVGQTGATATWTASDSGSGLATAASGNVALDTSHAGTRTATAPIAKDKVGHSGAAATCEYEVQYRFYGYGAPFEGSNVVNIGLGNRTYKVRWQLKKSDGNRISDAEGVALATQMSASSQKVECLSYLRREENSLDEEQSSAAVGEFRYDTYNNYFVYSYKAPRRGCHVLSISDADGVNTKVWRFLFL